MVHHARNWRFKNWHVQLKRSESFSYMMDRSMPEAIAHRGVLWRASAIVTPHSLRAAGAGMLVFYAAHSV